MAPDQRRQQVGGNRAVIAKEVLDQAFFVNGMGNGFADTNILEFFDFEVEGQVAGVERRAGHDIKVGIVGRSGQIFDHSLFHALDVASLEGQEAGRVIGDHAEEDLINLRCAAPVIHILLNNDVVAFNPFHKFEGAGSHTAAGGRTIAFASRLNGSRAGDGEHIHGEVRQEGRQRVAQIEFNGIVVNFLDFGDDTGVIKTTPHRLVIFKDLAGVVVGVRGKAPALEVEDHSIGIEIGAIMEFDAFAQLASPYGCIFIGRAFFSQGRDWFGAAGLILVERLQHLASDAERLAIGHDGRVKLDGIGAPSEDEDNRFCIGFIGLGGTGRQSHAGDQDDGQHNKQGFALHNSLL